MLCRHNMSANQCVKSVKLTAGIDHPQLTAGLHKRPHRGGLRHVQYVRPNRGPYFRGLTHVKGKTLITVKSNMKMNKITQNELIETTHFNIHNFMYTANAVINQQA